MPVYEYVCPTCGEYRDLVRPIGHEETCAACGKPMVRSQVHHFETRGPTVNTANLNAGFVEASAEREHIYQQAEARVGHPIPRPNDWARPTAKAQAMLKRGEVDTAQLQRERQGTTIRGGL